MTIPIRIDTEYGPIHAELNDDAAPITTTNFLHYIDEGMYDRGIIHRTVTAENNSNANLEVDEDRDDKASLPNDEIAIQVIQAGVNPEREDEVGDPIPLERTTETGLSHVDGTLSMARLTPDSATSDFFICIGDQPSLDFGGMRNPDGQGFAAFGKVTSGMDVVRTIQAQPARGQQLDPVIPILRIERES